MRKAFIGAVIAPVVAAVLAPPAQAADMNLGSYNVLSNRWTNVAWIWQVYPCNIPGQLTESSVGCVDVQALPQPQNGAYYGGQARLVGNTYSFTTDVPDGLRCLGQSLPTRDTYTWDATTLAGTVDSHFDVGCFNGPPGVNTWTFALTRM